ncbi:MAG: tail protein X [Roseburia sp.]|nr:tail protein X [Roseburia sp.]
MSKTYTTVQGDMWDSIAYAQLGDVAHTDKLMNLNPQYQDYFIFPAGIVLNLPDAVAESVTDSTPPWKRTSG